MQFERLVTSDDIRSLIRYHNEHSDSVVIDVETTSKYPRQAKLIDIQIIGREQDHAVIFSGDHVEFLLELAPHIILIGHNYKYDAHVLFRHGVDLLSRTWRDTLLIGHLLDENRESYALDSYVKEHWNDDYKEKFWTKYKTYEEASEEDKTEYACKDVVYSRLLFGLMVDRLRDQQIPGSLVEHTHRLQASLLRTEIKGIRIDLGYLQELGVRLKRRIDELGPEMRSMVENEINVLELEMWLKTMSGFKTDKGRANCKRPEFSFESSKQLQDLLYRNLGLPVQRNAKTRAISTDYESLSRIRDNHPVVDKILENRELQKVYGTYIEGTLDRIDQERIYPEFRVNGTTTGRISHSNPNMAQLPKTGGVRAIYIPDPRRRFISADYNQLEVIIEVNLTGDKTLVRMLENGESKHDVTSRELGCSRDLAKTLNFAMQYWCGPGKVAKLLGVDSREGQRIYDKYWEVYSGSRRLKAQTDKMVENGVSLVNLFGRKRSFPPGKRTVWDKDLRQAYNFLIQGTGADITSKAFYLIDAWLRKMEYGEALFTVHDEILIEVREEDGEAAEAALINTMLGVGNDLGLKIPLQATGSGPMTAWQD